ncbi:alpha/beta hydrolase [Nitratireductor mangrovi]|uniref:Alpha/beta hydrolase n=1 Tax=Nitratireductor mangrovi TaxID=2599600 RepID=A0A5B8KXQ8_9HYPH|nr:alpha/beta hydrolase [Nitratireductor mangrovi]QDZ00352.1 alpha/beta hydrolase [Nitratireductor mangrovi]
MTSRGRYECLIDAGLWPFIDRTYALFPAAAEGFPIEWQRAAYDAMCQAFHAGRPPGVRISDLRFGAARRTVPARRYSIGGTESNAVVVYYHGGGFVFGGLDSHDDICAELCATTGFDVVSADYRLAPEDPHPAAFEDALVVFDAVAATSRGPVLLCGESAGGNLAAAVAHAVRFGNRRPAGVMLVYPTLGSDRMAGSFVEHAHAPLLSASDVDRYDNLRSGDAPPFGDPSFAPLCDQDFAGLPPTAIITAECDPLSSEGQIYRDRLLAAGGRGWWREEPRLVHGFLRARAMVPRAAEAFSRIASGLTALARGEEPFAGARRCPTAA